MTSKNLKNQWDLLLTQTSYTNQVNELIKYLESEIKQNLSKYLVKDEKQAKFIIHTLSIKRLWRLESMLRKQEHSFNISQTLTSLWFAIAYHTESLKDLDKELEQLRLFVAGLAESAAWSAARSAESAARSAWLAAESAARSAWLAAESARLSAGSAAWVAESAAESARLSAWSAAWVAESAAKSAWLAAWSAALKQEVQDLDGIFKNELLCG